MGFTVGNNGIESGPRPKGDSVYFVEYLTLYAWVRSVLPRLLGDRRATDNYRRTVYYFDGSQLGVLFARATVWLVRTKIKWLDYCLDDISDESGRPIRLRIDSQDLFKVQEGLVNSHLFREAVGEGKDSPRFSMFLSKKATLVTPPARHSLRRAIYMIHACAWMSKRNHPAGCSSLLFLERIPWFSSILPIAEEQRIGIVAVTRSSSVRSSLRRRIPGGLVNVLRVLRDRGIWATLSLLGRELKGLSPLSSKRKIDCSGVPLDTLQRPTRIAAVEYLGQLNLNKPERHSDLFFWQQSPLAGNDILLTFSASNCPLDGSVLAETSEHGISVMATYPGATTLADAPVFSGPKHRRRVIPGVLALKGNSAESSWLQEQQSDYWRLRNYWAALFAKNKVGVFVTYNKMDAAYCAMADALESLGGITVNYQRSCELYDCPDIAGIADVTFKFSQDSLDTEIRSGSTAKYHVINGYLGDHRSQKLRENARDIRDTLQRKGAKHVVTFLDESTHDDDRWVIGHRAMREDYTFLLEKVLAEPWFGLIIKPKKPTSLRERIGSVSELLEKAEATGRVFLFEDGGIQGWYPPAAAALAADLTIHEHLIGATAGLESALAGAPTLLLDREAAQVESLYRLGVGRVVFTDWERLWEACLQHWAGPEGFPELGDWSPILNEFDPFRDGRAAERMGTYIQWMLEGLRAGLDRETVMAEAAERYCAKWGEDTITRLGSKPLDIEPALSNYVAADR
ncbi:hypothetical protein FIM07_01365 [SAR202 cluster bacterium AD-802-F09_MRT_200m]|nr:hypothetical protein [SAR202 cluster bacterium AD-802-F09_MRT_200m]